MLRLAGHWSPIYTQFDEYSNSEDSRDLQQEQASLAFHGGARITATTA